MTNLLDCFSVKSLHITLLCHCVAEQVIPIVVLETILVAFVVLGAFIVLIDCTTVFVNAIYSSIMPKIFHS